MAESEANSWLERFAEGYRSAFGFVIRAVQLLFVVTLFSTLAVGLCFATPLLIGKLLLPDVGRFPFPFIYSLVLIFGVFLWNIVVVYPIASGVANVIDATGGDDDET